MIPHRSGDEFVEAVRLIVVPLLQPFDPFNPVERSIVVMDNWETCIADPGSHFAQFQDQLEPIVTGCRAWNNGGHYDAQAMIDAGYITMPGRR